MDYLHFLKFHPSIDIKNHSLVEHKFTGYEIILSLSLYNNFIIIFEVDLAYLLFVFNI